MKICGYVGKLRSSQPLQPMNVKIKLHSDWYNVKMDYYEWMKYLHDEIEKYEYKASKPIHIKVNSESFWTGDCMNG